MDEQRRPIVEEVLEIFKKWDHDMRENSTTATIYTTWHFFFFKQLLNQYIEQEYLRLSLVGSYPFQDFAQIILNKLDKNPTDPKFNRLCDKANEEYNGNKSCAYNIAKAMADAYLFLSENISPQINDWKWGNVHANLYENFPWTSTTLRNLFSREVPIGGNGYTIKVSKVAFKTIYDKKTFKSFHTQFYKQIVQFGDDSKGEDDVYLYSLEGGENGNLFAGPHYFDMAIRHLNGGIYPAYTDQQQMDKVSHQKLVL